MTHSTGSLAATPATVAFGNVAVGQAAKATISLQGGSSGPVEITQLSLSGQGFAMSGQPDLPITVPADGTYDLSVQFDPTTAGAATGQITATSNSSTNGTVVVSLSGTGTSAPGTAALTALSCTNASLTGSGTDSCSVTLSAAAGSGGMTVDLSSSSSSVTVPASVTVASGATRATFTAAVASVTTATAVTLGASAGDITETFALRLDAPASILTLSTTSVAFGNVAVNTSTTQTVSLSSTGTTSVTVDSAALTGTGFTISGATFPLILAPNQKATLAVEFDPTAAGAANGQLTITSDSSANVSQTIALSGTGTAVLTALSCSIASMTGSGSDTCTVRLNAAAPTTGFSVSLSSNDPAVTVPASVMVAAGATSATFSATVSAVATAQLAKMEAGAGSVSESFSLQLNVSGPALSINAASIGFGNVALNTPATQTVILSSTGSSPVTVNSATLNGVAFTLLGPTFPQTLTPGQTITLGIQFDPTVPGAASGVLTIVSTSTGNGIAAIAVTGTGSSSISYSVDLSWDAPAASIDPVAGYNVFRTLSGASDYQLLNAAVDAQTTYVDSNVQNGATYDYIIESVDVSGVASAPTNPVSVTIP